MFKTMNRSVVAVLFSFAIVGMALAKVTTGPNIAAGSATKSDADSLGGSDRYETCISTDKPIYRLGEQVFIRGVVLNARTHKPVREASAARFASLRVLGPNGQVIANMNAHADGSVWFVPWTIPNHLLGGEYKIVSGNPQMPACAPAERKFDIRVVRAPRLNSQIKFVKDGYAPGDSVQANLDVSRAEGGVPAGADVSVSANIDGRTVNGVATKLDANGHCVATLKLPANIERGEGTLALAISDGGVVETASKTIPILVKFVELNTYPESGDLLAGFENRVYFEAKQSNGKPADVSGKLMSKRGAKSVAVTTFKTEHEGRGRFEFVPDVQSSYFLKIDRPTGLSREYALPKVREHGALIRAIGDTYSKDDPLALDVASDSSNCRLTLSKRESELCSAAIKTAPSSTKSRTSKFTRLLLTPPANIDGVLIATVWDSDGAPLAERLIFRKPSGAVSVKVTGDKKQYEPGEHVRLKVKTSGPNGQPVSASVGLTVTNESIQELIDKREQAPDLPAMFFLEPEVRELADARVYLDRSNPASSHDVDLLMGTQGWRRFAFVTASDFIAKYDDKARRVLASQMVTNGSPLVPLGVIGPSFTSMRNSSINLPGGSRFAFGPVPGRGMPLPRGSVGSVEKEIGRVEGPRDMNMFQVEPTVIDERHYTSGRDERHQKTAPALPWVPASPEGFAGERYGGTYVREYAHKPEDRSSSDGDTDNRKDFADTIFCNAATITDAKTGEATVEFDLSDNVTTFRVMADAFDKTGSLGACQSKINASKSLYADAKVPLEVSFNDKILLPLNLVNNTDQILAEPKIVFDGKGGLKVQPVLLSPKQMNAKERMRLIQPIVIGADGGEYPFTLTGRAGRYADKITRTLKVVSSGYPFETGSGGLLEPNKDGGCTLTVPDDLVTGTGECRVVIDPSPLGNLTQALQRLILEPCGCFEQTSSTSYPLTMAQQYFLSHQDVDPKLIADSKEKLDKGYKMLLSFWCPDRGYEWFGKNPGHEPLTAYGLLHFTDMSKVRDVDQNMVEVTRKWLLSKKDGKGGFTRLAPSLHTWIEDRDCSNAYIVWALLETGQSATDMKLELETLKTSAEKTENAYVMALAANSFFLSGDKDEAHRLMDRLAKLQKTDGSVDGVKASVVGSGGESLEVEGTALAMLAWLRDDQYVSSVERSVKYLAGICKDGRYGTTQSTVLALRAILQYDKQNSHPVQAGKVQLTVDDKPVGNWIEFDEKTKGALEFPFAKGVLTSGPHKFVLTMKDGCRMPFTVAVKGFISTPPSDKESHLALQTELTQEKLAEGTATEVVASITNNATTAAPNPVAIVGIPGGLEVRHDQLKELVKKQIIDSYEVRGREVVLYWRSLNAGEKVVVPISVLAAVPGSYTGPASSSYLYYNDEHKTWQKGLHSEISPKKAGTPVAMTR